MSGNSYKAYHFILILLANLPAITEKEESFSFSIEVTGMNGNKKSTVPKEVNEWILTAIGDDQILIYDTAD